MWSGDVEWGCGVGMWIGVRWSGWVTGRLDEAGGGAPTSARSKRSACLGSGNAHNDARFASAESIES